MAGSDASIYSLIRPQATVQLEDPLAQREKQMRLQQLMGAQEMQGLQLNEAREGSQRNRRIQDLFATNPNATPDQIAPIDYRAAAAMRKEQLEAEAKRATIGKDKAAAGKSEHEVAIGRLERGASILASAKDQASYDMALRVMADTFGPNAVEKMPPQFDPSYVKASIDRGMTRAQQLADERAKQQAAETGRHNLAMETNAAGQLAVSRVNLGVAQGNLGVSRERLAHEKATPQRTYDAERGLVVNTRDGTAAPVLNNGAPLAPKDKPLNEFQAKGQLFGTRAAEADKIIRDLSAKGDNFPGSIKATAGEVPLVGGALAAAINPLPGFMGGPSAAQQKVEQAQRNFINAALRVESGAVIADSEFDNAKKQYFPQRGDTPGVIEQKAANRKSVIEGLRVASGPAGPRVAAAASPAVPTAAEIDAELRRRKVIQ